MVDCAKKIAQRVRLGFGGLLIFQEIDASTICVNVTTRLNFQVSAMLPNFREHGLLLHPSQLLFAVVQYRVNFLLNCFRRLVVSAMDQSILAAPALAFIRCWPRRPLPRLPGADHCRLPCPALWCPAVCHGEPLIVRSIE